jgi:hypothetical protein
MNPRNTSAAPVDGAAAVGEVASKKRCSASPTSKKSVEQAKSAKRGHGGLPKSDRSERRDHFGPYTGRQLAQMDKQFSAAMAHAHPKRVRS